MERILKGVGWPRKALWCFSGGNNELEHKWERVDLTSLACKLPEATVLSHAGSWRWCEVQLWPPAHMCGAVELGRHVQSSLWYSTHELTGGCILTARRSKRPFVWRESVVWNRMLDPIWHRFEALLDTRASLKIKIGEKCSKGRSVTICLSVDSVRHKVTAQF